MAHPPREQTHPNWGTRSLNALHQLPAEGGSPFHRSYSRWLCCYKSDFIFFPPLLDGQSCSVSWDLSNARDRSLLLSVLFVDAPLQSPGAAGGAAHVRPRSCGVPAFNGAGGGVASKNADASLEGEK